MTTKIRKVTSMTNQKWIRDIKVSPCLFCQNPNLQSVSYLYTTSSSVYCPECGMIGPRGITVEMAVDYWNTLNK